MRHRVRRHCTQHVLQSLPVSKQSELVLQHLRPVLSACKTASGLIRNAPSMA